MTTAETGSGSLEAVAVGDIEGRFFVPSYQRGYRWGDHEVRQLLDDIRESGGSTYYLQPVVVKHLGDRAWELIDGQQRLTTLWLIFRYLQREHLPSAHPNYTLTYETRPGSKEYLETLNEEDADTNIDFFHLYGAYRCIESWFESHGHRAGFEATRAYGFLFESVKVLWYEAPEELESSELFTRLNIGRIPLTDAELVKALLLSRSGAGPGETDRSLEMAAYWDGFERDLRSPEVWAFITGDALGEATHISLLLDTLAGGPRGRDRSAFYTFETLREEIIADPLAFWRRVVDLHSLVLGWYEDRDLFHKVGFLTAIGMSFQELVELARGKGRRAFDEALDQEIRDRLTLRAEDLADLSYTSTSRKASEVLLLMNVETVRTMAGSSERYSFRAHAEGAWSLEHIHAQGAEDLNTVEQWEAWLEHHRAALIDVPGVGADDRQALLDRIDEVLSAGVTRQTFGALEPDVTAVFSPDEDADAEVHWIANLALLDTGANAALSNSVFEVKRRRIIELDKRGTYIPACTRNVFLKYYTGAGDQQLHFWSSADRQAYLDAMKERVGQYLLNDGVAE